MLFLFRDVGSLHLSTFYRRIFFRSPGSHFHDKSSVQGRYSFVKLGGSARFWWKCRRCCLMVESTAWGTNRNEQVANSPFTVPVGPGWLFIMYVDTLGMYPDAPCYGNGYTYIILRLYECSCGHVSPFSLIT